MQCNVFQLDNMLWHQLSSTVMGTSTACLYATLYYYAYNEKCQLLPKFGHQLLYLKPFIDDGLRIWLRLSLRWTNTGLVKEVDFLDLWTYFFTYHLNQHIHQESCEAQYWAISALSTNRTVMLTILYLSPKQLYTTSNAEGSPEKHCCHCSEKLHNSSTHNATNNQNVNQHQPNKNGERKTHSSCTRNIIYDALQERQCRISTMIFSKITTVSTAWS